MTQNKFEANLNSLRKLTLTADEKGKMFKTLLRYAEAHPAPEKVPALSLFDRILRALKPIKIK